MDGAPESRPGLIWPGDPIEQNTHTYTHTYMYKYSCT